MKKVSLEVNIPVIVLRENSSFIAYSPALELSTAGKTLLQAKKRFSEAVDIFFEELVKNGTLDEALAELGWKKVKKEWTPPIIISNEMQTVSVSV